MPEIDIIFAALLKREDIWIAKNLIRQVWNNLKTPHSKQG
jgi:hypothetical protein